MPKKLGRRKMRREGVGGAIKHKIAFYVHRENAACFVFESVNYSSIPFSVRFTHIILLLFHRFCLKSRK